MVLGNHKLGGVNFESFLCATVSAMIHFLYVLAYSDFNSFGNGLKLNLRPVQTDVRDQNISREGHIRGQD